MTPDTRLRNGWRALAPTIGYEPKFLPALRGLMSDLLDHSHAVRRADTGQLAIYTDPYGVGFDISPRAARLGLTIDYIGPGLWLPGSTVALVLRVIDADIARRWIVTDARRAANPGMYVVVNQPARFMPKPAPVLMPPCPPLSKPVLMPPCPPMPVLMPPCPPSPN